VLDQTTVDGTIDLGADMPQTTARRLSVTGGMTLNGTVLLGSDVGGRNGLLTLDDTETLGGTGTVVVGQSSTFSSIAPRQNSGEVVTFGPGITLRGGTASIGTDNASVINQGTILTSGTANTLSLTNFVNGGTIRADAGAGLHTFGTWSNSGTIHVEGGGELFLAGSYHNAGVFEAVNATTLGSDFTLADLGAFHRTGGTVNLRGTLDNRGTTLALDDTTGPWNLTTGGTILGGTITTAGSARLFAQVLSAAGTLDGVTLNGTLDMTPAGSQVFVTHGLTLNGTVHLGRSNLFRFSDSSTLDGTGTALLDGHPYDNTVGPSFGPTTGLTLHIGPHVTVRGGGDFGSGFGSSGAVVTEAVIDAGSNGMDFPGGVTVDGTGALANDPTGTLVLDESLLGNTTNVDGFALRGRTLVPGANGAPQVELEVMSADLGPVLAGFTHNFAYGTLEVGTNRTLQLVDQSRNSPGTTPEALYLDTLIVHSGATLDVNGLKVYVRSVQIDGAVVNGTVTQVNKAASTVTLATSGSPSTVGQPVTFTATLTGAGPTPTGTVKFQDVLPDGTGVILAAGVALDAQGVATFSTSALAAGTHTVTAVYVGDGNYQGAFSNDVAQRVDLLSATMTLATSGTPSTAGQPVTFTATVSSATRPTPTGTVRFEVRDSRNVTVATMRVALDGDGLVRFSANALGAGMYGVLATYEGDGTYGPVNAVLAGQTVVVAPATVQFDQVAYTVREDAGRAVITLTRSQGGAPASVVVAVSDGSATRDQNYTAPAEQVVTFAANQDHATVTIGIADDGLVGANQTVFLTLSNPDGVALGDPYQAVLTILDSDFLLGLSPNQQFVAAAFGELLGRPVDKQGLASWTSRLDHGASPSAVVNGILQSPEYRTLVVRTAYQELLHRDPDAFGLKVWTQFLAAGGTSEDLRGEILCSPEYRQLRGGGTDAGFLRALYADVLGRPLDPSGADNWGRLLAQPDGCPKVVAAVLHSDERHARLIRRGYARIPNREPDPSGLASYQILLRNGQNPDNLLNSLLTSTESICLINLQASAAPNVRYVDQLYADLLSRSPTCNELTDAVNALTAGTQTRAALADALTHLPEYRLDVVRAQVSQYLHVNASTFDANQILALFANNVMVQTMTFTEGDLAIRPYLMGQDQFQLTFLDAHGNTVTLTFPVDFLIMVSHITGSFPYFHGRAQGDQSVYINDLFQDVGATPPTTTGVLEVTLSSDEEDASTNMQPEFSAHTRFTYEQFFHDPLDQAGYLDRLVRGYYLRFFHRGADEATEVAPWKSALLSNATADGVIAFFVSSQEYFNLTQA
jgi:uncharacterized repeat protein (TIGR01451 family)